MKQRIFGFVLCGVFAFLVVACSGQSALQAPSASQAVGASAPSHTHRVSVVAAPNTAITLRPGTSIGVNTFPDGDTSSGGQGQPVDGYGCHASMAGAYHIHTHLSIFDPNGNQIMVPWGIGIVPPWSFNTDGNDILTGTCYYNLHTHDRSGVIHDEAHVNNNYTLGTFFDVWGEPLSTTNVAGYTGTVWVFTYVPGSGNPGSWSSTTDPRTIALTQHLELTLSVGRKFTPVPHYGWAY